MFESYACAELSETAIYPSIPSSVTFAVIRSLVLIRLLNFQELVVVEECFLSLLLCS